MIVVQETKLSVIRFVENRDMARRLKNNHFSFWWPVKKNKVAASEARLANEGDTFQDSLRVMLIIGQIFSLLPVGGLFSRKPTSIRFTWASWRVLYLLLSLLGQTFITVMCIHKALNTTATLNGTTPVIFYGTTCITTALFLRMATQWPELARHMARVEELDPGSDRQLTFKCNVTCVIVLTLALGVTELMGLPVVLRLSPVEHVLSLLSAAAGALACGDGGASSYRGFVTHFYPWVFRYIPYSLALGLVTQFLHFQSTFIWNFSDLFVICMSYYLTSRLDHVNKKLLTAQGKYLPEPFWRGRREEYGRAVQATRRVDGVISGVVFISFANNLFFICLQLFNTLEDGIKGNNECSSRAKGAHSLLGGYEAAAYFVFSLVYLISRSVAVSLIAAQVHTASTAPAPVLYDVPSPVYCVEVQRFLDQVNGDKVALSGLQFFSVTRGLLLTVAGTIVTYELVMFQFTGSPAPDSSAITALTSNITTPSTL